MGACLFFSFFHEMKLYENALINYLHRKPLHMIDIAVTHESLNIKQVKYSHVHVRQTMKECLIPED
jgi:hypothetical protein